MGDQTSEQNVANVQTGATLGPSEFERAVETQQTIEQPSGDAAAEGASGQAQDVPAQIDPLELIQAQSDFTAQETTAPPSQADSLRFQDVQFSQQFPDELQPYEDVIMSRVVDVAKAAVTQLEQQARAQYEQEQTTQAQQALMTEIRDVMSSPLASAFQEHKAEVAAVAQSNPGLLRKVGVKGILKMFAPAVPQQAVQQPRQQPNLQQRRNAASLPPQHSAAPTQPASPVRNGMDLNAAIEAAFNAAADGEL